MIISPNTVNILFLETCQGKEVIHPVSGGRLEYRTPNQLMAIEDIKILPSLDVWLGDLPPAALITESGHSLPHQLGKLSLIKLLQIVLVSFQQFVNQHNQDQQTASLDDEEDLA